jgi:hypothetical protein
MDFYNLSGGEALKRDGELIAPPRPVTGSSTSGSAKYTSGIQGKDSSPIGFCATDVQSRDSEPWLATLKSKLESLKSDQVVSERPNDWSIEWTKRALEEAHELSFRPKNVSHSCDGGVVLSFVTPTRYADIEFFNDNEIYAVFSVKDGEASSWPISADEKSLAEALSTIRDQLR